MPADSNPTSGTRRFRKKVAKVFRSILKLGRKRSNGKDDTLMTANNNTKITEGSIQAPKVDSIVGLMAMNLDRLDVYSALSPPLHGESEHPTTEETGTTEMVTLDEDGRRETVAEAANATVAEPMDTPALNTLNTPDSVHAFDDPILQQLLAKRQKMMDVSASDELERQRRMYNMLRHSHHYKKLQVRDANARWGSAMTDLDFALAGGVGDGSQTLASVGEKGVARSGGDATVSTGTDGGLDGLDLEDLALAAAANFVTGVGSSFGPPSTRPPLIASGSAVTSRTKARRVSFSETITVIQPVSPPRDQTECEEGCCGDDLLEAEEDSESHGGPTMDEEGCHPAVAARDLHPKLLLARKGNNTGLQQLEKDPALSGDDHVAQRQHPEDTDDLGDFVDAVATTQSSSSSLSASSSGTSLSSLQTTAHPSMTEAGESCGVNYGDETVQVERTCGIPADSVGAGEEGNIASPLDERLTMHMKPPLPPGAVKTTRIAGAHPQLAKKRWFRGSIGRDPLLGEMSAGSPSGRRLTKATAAFVSSGSSLANHLQAPPDTIQKCASRERASSESMVESVNSEEFSNNEEDQCGAFTLMNEVITAKETSSSSSSSGGTSPTVSCFEDGSQAPCLPPPTSQYEPQEAHQNHHQTPPLSRKKVEHGSSAYTTFPPIPPLPISLTSCRAASVSTNITSMTSATATTAIEQSAHGSRHSSWVRQTPRRQHIEEQPEESGSHTGANPFRVAKLKIVKVMSKLHLLRAPVVVAAATEGAGYVMDGSDVAGLPRIPLQSSGSASSWPLPPILDAESEAKAERSRGPMERRLVGTGSTLLVDGV
ncbi:hypothetical protein HK102_010901 [Quaeritorhiza haematococci]|nr:hypothetical protein HK102_010901 [Quaeritorhiza haematococci]